MSTYKSFPQSNLIREWSKLIELTEEEIEKIYEEWKIIEEENKAINTKMFEERNQKTSETVEYLKKLGIEVKKYKNSNSFIPKFNGYQSWFVKNIKDPIESKYPPYRNSIPTAHMDTKTINGIEVRNNQSPTNLVQLHKNIKWQYDKQKREVDKVDKMLIKSIEYATLNGIDIEGMDSKDIILTVDEIARDKFLEEQCPDGTEVYLKHACDECSTYIMGERRCECGNRRIGIEVEGDLISGYDWYPEPW